MHWLYQFTGRKDGFIGEAGFFPPQIGDNLMDWLTHMYYFFHNSELSLELPRVNSNSLFG